METYGLNADEHNYQKMSRKALQLQREGKFQKAIDLYHQAFRLAPKVFGERSSELQEMYSSVTRRLLKGLKLTYDHTDIAKLVQLLLEFLKALQHCNAALVGAELCQVMLAVGCAYRHLTNTELALHFISKALELANAFPQRRICLPSLYLGMCAALNDRSHHEQALKYAKRAVRQAYKDLQTNTSDRQEKLTLLCVGCHNAAVQEEKLSHNDAAIKWYRRAVALLQSHGSEKHISLLADMRKSLDAASSVQMRRTQRFASLRHSVESSPLRERLSSQSMLPSPCAELNEEIGSLRWSITRIASQDVLRPTLTTEATLASDCRHRKKVEDKLRESYAIRIQAFIRGTQARALYSLMLRSRPQLAARIWVRGTEYYLATAREQQTLFEVKLTTIGLQETRITVIKAKGLTAKDALQSFNKKDLSVQDAVICIQRRVRGILARNHFRRLRNSCKLTKVIGRSAVKYRGQYTTVNLLSLYGDFILQVSEAEEIAVPASLRDLPLNHLLLQLFADQSGPESQKGNSDRRMSRISVSSTAMSRPTSNSDLQSCAVIIQKYYRAHLASQKVQLLRKKGSLLFRSCKYMGAHQLFSVAFYAEGHDTVVKAFGATGGCEERFSTAESPRELFDRLMFVNEQLALAPELKLKEKAAQRIQKVVRGVLARMQYRELHRKNKRKLQYFSTKLVQAETIHVAIYQLEEKVQIETFKRQPGKELKYCAHSVFFSFEDVAKIYGRMPSWEELYQDIQLKDEALAIYPIRKLEGEVSVQAVVSMLRLEELRGSQSETRMLLRASRKFGDDLWVVTMTALGESVVEFAAFCTGQQCPLRLQTNVQTLADILQLPVEEVLHIGKITIKMLLKLADGALTLDLSIRIPSRTRLATMLQACVRGFLARRRFRGKICKGNLITCQALSLQQQNWVLYAYRESDIHIVGFCRDTREHADAYISKSHFLKFPPTLSVKRIIENFVFPRLHLTEGAAPSQSNTFPLIKRSHRRCSSTSFISLATPPVTKETILSTTPIRTINGMLAPMKAMKIDETRKRLLFAPRPSVIRPLAAAENLPSNPKLLFRSVLELGGVVYLASIFQAHSVLLLKLVDSRTGKTIKKSIATEKEASEILCEDLINRIEVVNNSEIRIRSNGDVLYRRSTYISEKFFHVTILKSSQGVLIEAFDPMRKATLHLAVRLKLKEPIQQQLTSLMKCVRLRVETGVELLELDEQM